MKINVFVLLVFASVVVLECRGVANNTSKISINTGQIAYRVDKVNIDLDKESAVKIAKIVFYKVYAERCNISDHEPFIAVETENSWVVRGTLKQKEGKITLGGVPEIEIRKSDCCILHLTHYK